MLKIDIWSDYVCQYCYIGKKELENALRSTGLENEVEIEYHSFELSPDAPTEQTLHIYDFMKDLTGKSLEEVQQMMAQTAERAASVGLQYNFEELYHQRTHKAHRVAQYAKENGKGVAFQERLFYAVHTENAFLSDTDTLVKLAKEVGLDQEKVLEIADDENAYAQEVQLDQAYAAQVGVRGVPFYLFNNQYAVSGAQPEEVFKELLDKLVKELNLKQTPKLFGESKNICGPDGCER